MVCAVISLLWKLTSMINCLQEGEEGEGELSVNQMELLELEMRARAIKAMLSAQDRREKLDS